jgi:CRP-like cAMP-binding protein
MTETVPHLLDTLPAPSRERLLQVAEPVEFPAGTRLFREGRRADRFWVLRSGSVRLDLEVPTTTPVTVESLHHGDLLGWSWLFPPHTWHFGARTEGHVGAWEFDAAAVREMCDTDPEFGRVLVWQVARIIAHRLHRARTRLLQLYGPNGVALTPE